MKKNIIKVAFVAAFAMIAGYNVYSSQKADVMSDLALENVEALAQSEGGTSGMNCYCKTNWFSPNVCSANASGAFCGSGNCPSYDGNCR